MAGATMSGNRLLVIAETREHKPTPLTLELIGLAQSLARQISGTVDVALIGAESAADTLIAHGAHVVHLCSAEAEDYEGEVWLANAEKIARDTKPVAILMGHTPAGADLAPRLAFRLESAAATGCVAVAADSGKLLFTRACFGGNVRETSSFATAPAVATVKAGAGAALPAEERLSGEIVRVRTHPVQRRVRVIGRQRETAAAQRLEDAKIVVSGGRGLEGPEGFGVIEDLARVLGAAVGSSRVPCDLGWCPHSWQIGLTGKTVTPDLYFAIGISGAGHHMAGCGNAKTIVAINTDPQAAIFKEARFGIVGDYRTIVPALIRAVSELERV